jgi:hypothetical protein
METGSFRLFDRTMLAEQVIQTLMKKEQGAPAMAEDEADVRAADQGAVDDQAHDGPRSVELILEGRFVNARETHVPALDASCSSG